MADEVKELHPFRTFLGGIPVDADFRAEVTKAVPMDQPLQAETPSITPSGAADNLAGTANGPAKD